MGGPFYPDPKRPAGAAVRHDRAHFIAADPDWAIVYRIIDLFFVGGGGSLNYDPHALLGIVKELKQRAAPPVTAAFINAIAEEGTKAEAVHWLQKTWNELCELRAAATPQVLSGCAVRAAIQREAAQAPDDRLHDILHHLPEVLWAEAQRFGNRYDARAGDWPAQDNIRFGEHLLAALANALSAARQRALDSRPTRDVTKLSEAPIG